MITFTVYGIAMPQGSKTPVVRNGRAVLLDGRNAEARERFAGWRAAVAQAARDYCAAHEHVAPYDKPCRVNVEFALPKPTSTPKRVVHASKKPDLDKLVRAVLDSITGILITDDARVVEILARKRFAIDEPAHAVVTLEAAA